MNSKPLCEIIDRCFADEYAGIFVRGLKEFIDEM